MGLEPLLRNSGDEDVGLGVSGFGSESSKRADVSGGRACRLSPTLGLEFKVSLLSSCHVAVRGTHPQAEIISTRNGSAEVASTEELAGRQSFYRQLLMRPEACRGV